MLCAPIAAGIAVRRYALFLGLLRRNLRVQRASPPGRFATPVFSGVRKSSSLVCVIAYNKHMRLPVRQRRTSVCVCVGGELAASPKSVSRPAGWRSLLDQRPREATVAAKFMGRCPHCQTRKVSLPSRIDGEVVGSYAVLTDQDVREFPGKTPRRCRLGQSLYLFGLRARQFRTAVRRPPATHRKPI